jgi:hypothetical protein
MFSKLKHSAIAPGALNPILKPMQRRDLLALGAALARLASRGARRQSPGRQAR